MSSFTANAMAYNVTTENELAEVLSHYNSDFVFSVVDDAMKKRFQSVPIIAMPNVVAAWEQNFKAIIAQYGESATGEVSRVRDETYREIIDSICKEFSLNFTVDETVDATVITTIIQINKINPKNVNKNPSGVIISSPISQNLL